MHDANNKKWRLNELDEKSRRSFSAESEKCDNFEPKLRHLTIFEPKVKNDHFQTGSKKLAIFEPEVKNLTIIEPKVNKRWISEKKIKNWILFWPLISYQPYLSFLVMSKEFLQNRQNPRWFDGLFRGNSQITRLKGLKHVYWI